MSCEFNEIREEIMSERDSLFTDFFAIYQALIVNHCDTLSMWPTFEYAMLRSSSFNACFFFFTFFFDYRKEKRRKKRFLYIANSFNKSTQKKIRENAIWWLKMYLFLAKGGIVSIFWHQLAALVNFSKGQKRSLISRSPGWMHKLFRLDLPCTKLCAWIPPPIGRSK